MDLFEDLTVRLAKERIEAALHDAELRRAIQSAGGHQTLRVRFGNALVRLGQWVLGHPSSAILRPSTHSE